MKSTTIGILLFLVIVFIGGYIVLGSAKNNGNTVTGDVIAGNPQVLQGEVQKVVLSEEGFNYYPSEVRVKANQPVSLSLDDKVKGCLRSVVIRELGLSKYLKTAVETLDFIPMQKGTLTLTCSMGMGSTKLVVE